LIDSLLERFVNIIVDERKMASEDVKKSPTGASSRARRRRQRVLIDGIGYLDDAVERAKKLANLE
jgi:ClpP class serine protease